MLTIFFAFCICYLFYWGADVPCAAVMYSDNYYTYNCYPTLIKKCFRKDNCNCVWSSDSDLMASGGDDKRVLCWQLDRAVTATIPGYQPAVEQYGKN